MKQHTPVTLFFDCPKGKEFTKEYKEIVNYAEGVTFDLPYYPTKGMCIDLLSFCDDFSFNTSHIMYLESSDSIEFPDVIIRKVTITDKGLVLYVKTDVIFESLICNHVH